MRIDYPNLVRKLNRGQFTSVYQDLLIVLSESIKQAKVCLLINDVDFEPISTNHQYDTKLPKLSKLYLLNTSSNTRFQEDLPSHEFFTIAKKIMADQKEILLLSETRYALGLWSYRQRQDEGISDSQKFVGFVYFELEHGQIIEESQYVKLSEISSFLSYVVRSEAVYLKANKRANILTEFEKVIDKISQNFEHETQLETNILLEASQTARKIIDEEQCFSYVGLIEYHQLRHPKHRDHALSHSDEFINIKYLRYHMDLLSAFSEEETSVLRDKVKNERWEYTALNQDPLTGDPISELYAYGISGKVANSGVTEHVANTEQMHTEQQKIYRKLSDKTKSQLSIPITTGNGNDFVILGVITVEHVHAHAFSSQDQSNLQILAKLVGSTIASLRERRQLRALNQTLKVIYEDPDKDPIELQQQILEIACHALNAKAGGVYLLNRIPVDQLKEREVLLGYTIINRRNRVTDIDLSKLEEHGMAGYLYYNKSINHLIISNYNDSLWRHSVYEKAAREFDSVLKVKMFGHNTNANGQEVVGILNVDDHSHRHFTVADADFLQKFAQLAASALQRTQHRQGSLIWQNMNDFVGEVINQNYADEKQIVNVVNEIPKRLMEILEKKIKLKNIHSITSYIFDPSNHRFRYAPSFEGKIRADLFEEYAQEAKVFDEPIFRTDHGFRLVETMTCHIANDVNEGGEHFAIGKNRVFVSTHGISAFIALRIAINKHLTVLIFINFSTPQKFGTSYVKIVFGPIYEAIRIILKHLDERKKWLLLQKTLTAISQAASTIRFGTRNYEDVLSEISKQAVELMVDITDIGSGKIVQTDQDGNFLNPGCFGYITEYDIESERLIYVASYPNKLLYRYLREYKLNLKRTFAGEKIGLTARTALETIKTLADGEQDTQKLSAYCPDVANLTNNYDNPCFDYRAFAPLEDDQKIKSQLSIPLVDKANRELLGVLSLEHVDIDPFSEEDIKIFSIYADIAAIVIRSAQEIGRQSWFSQIFAHDVRNLIGRAYQSLHEIEINSVGIENAENFHDALSAIDELLWLKTLIDNDFSPYSSIQDPNKDTATSELSLEEVSAIVKDIHQEFAYTLKNDNDISLLLENQINRVGIVSGNKYEIKHILENMLINAWTYSIPPKVTDNNKGQLIRIELRIVDKVKLRVSVIDQGAGIQGEVLDLRPVYRLTGGIGLKLSKKLLEKRNGILDGKNNPLRGATIFFELPLKLGNSQ